MEENQIKDKLLPKLNRIITSNNMYDVDGKPVGLYSLCHWPASDKTTSIRATISRLYPIKGQKVKEPIGFNCPNAEVDDALAKARSILDAQGLYAGDAPYTPDRVVREAEMKMQSLLTGCPPPIPPIAGDDLHGIFIIRKKNPYGHMPSFGMTILVRPISEVKATGTRALMPFKKEITLSHTDEATVEACIKAVEKYMEGIGFEKREVDRKIRPNDPIPHNWIYPADIGVEKGKDNRTQTIVLVKANTVTRVPSITVRPGTNSRTKAQAMVEELQRNFIPEALRMGTIISPETVKNHLYAKFPDKKLNTEKEKKLDSLERNIEVDGTLMATLYSPTLLNEEKGYHIRVRVAPPKNGSYMPHANYTSSTTIDLNTSDRNRAVDMRETVQNLAEAELKGWFIASPGKQLLVERVRRRVAGKEIDVDLIPTQHALGKPDSERWCGYEISDYLRERIEYARNLTFKVQIKPGTEDKENGLVKIILQAVREFDEPIYRHDGKGMAQPWSRPLVVTALNRETAEAFRDTLLYSLNDEIAGLIPPATMPADPLNPHMTVHRSVEQFGEPTVNMILGHALDNAMQTPGIVPQSAVLEVLSRFPAEVRGGITR